MTSYICKTKITFQNYLLRLNQRHSKLSTFIFSILIIFETALLINSFFPDLNSASALNPDITFHMNRFYGLSQAIENGSYPFYINNHILGGYGYAVNLFYPDLTMLPFALLIKKLGLASSYKIMLFCYTLLCALFSFFTIRKITSDKLIAYIFVILYTFSLYRILDFASKGTIAECLAFTFIPLVFNGFYEIIYNNYKKWYIISIGYSLLIYTHLISSLLIFIILVIFTIRALLQKQITLLRFTYLILATIITILLSVFAIFPMLEQFESNSFYLQVYPLVSKTTICGSYIKDMIWGLFDGLNGSRFLLESLGILITLFLLPRLVLKNRTQLLKLADFCFITSIIIFFMISSFFPWTLFPFNLLAIIQFPFRFYIIITTLLSFSAAVYTGLFIKKYNYYISILLFLFIGTAFMIITIGSQASNQARSIVITNNSKNLYELNVMDINAAEYMPSKIPFLEPKSLYVRTFLTNRGMVITDSKTSEEIGSGKYFNQYFTFNVSNLSENTKQMLTLPLLYYKGYKATLNNEEIKLQQSNDGLVEIDFIGKGEIKVWYAGTTIQQISFLISLITLIGLILYLILRNRFKHLKN